MEELQEFQKVRVQYVLRSSEGYDGWPRNRRHPPQIGDVGTIVDIQRQPGLPVNYVVEFEGGSFENIWLGDFYREEIEAINS